MEEVKSNPIEEKKSNTVDEVKSNPSCNNKAVEPSQDIPIFLRKTYHMIDSCDATIACWSEDGETFVVKDPVKFERTIIPQFFKHSKFSSFVRQLNFYAFRKIKYSDTLRIDPKLEAETANYWRFRHDKFQKGKPELLSEIKRMNGQKTTKTASPPPAAKQPQDPDTLKSELSTLKKRIEDMTKNMDELTSLVKKVTLKQDQGTDSTAVGAGAKRKKLDDELPEPYVAVRPDDMISSMDIVDDDLDSAQSTELGMPDREDGSASISDVDFVDQLFTVFSEDDVEGAHIGPEEVISAPLTSLPTLPVPSLAPLALSPASSPPPSPPHSPRALPLPASPSPSSFMTLPPPAANEVRHKPDAELMDRLSEALSILPREMQERIVDRLVAAIMSTDSVEKTIGSVTDLSEFDVNSDTMRGAKVLSPSTVQDDENEDKPTPDVAIDMPLAAATLAALLSHYSSQVKAQNVQKSIPVIPVHA